MSKYSVLTVNIKVFPVDFVELCVSSNLISLLLFQTNMYLSAVKRTKLISMFTCNSLTAYKHKVSSMENKSNEEENV